MNDSTVADWRHLVETYRTAYYQQRDRAGRLAQAGRLALDYLNIEVEADDLLGLDLPDELRAALDALTEALRQEEGQ